MLKLEHFAYNVADPVSVCDWYAKNLGLKLVRQGPAPTFTSFLKDPATGVMLEFYRQTVATTPDYAAQHPLTLHIAFATDAPDALKAALTAAGAHPVSDDTLPDGTRLLMLRDPFGICIQFCQRGPGYFAD